MEHIIFNLSGVSIRHETLEGRNCLVVPTVMLTEGVHAGSSGPLYYPKEELSKYTAAWNAKPIVVYHPEINGQGVSACSPEVFESRKVGILMNTHFDGRLRTEAWIDIDKAKRVDPRILEFVEKNKTMEVSTGLFTDNEFSPGKFDENEYEFVARNHRPDHLALLPDKIGACSIEDGAGFIRNEENKGLLGRAVELLNKAMGLPTSNTPSHEMVKEKLDKALRMKFNPEEPFMVELFINSVFDDHLIYHKDGKFFQISYSVDTTGVTFQGEAIEVLKVTEFIPIGSNVSSPESDEGEEMVDNNLSGKTGSADGHSHTVTVNENGNGTAMEADGHSHRIRGFQVLEENGHTHSLNRGSLTENEEGVMKRDPAKLTDNDRVTIVDGLISNEKSPWVEADRDYMLKFDESRLSTLEEQFLKDDDSGVSDDIPVEKPLGNVQEPKKLTAQEWIDSAPPEMQEVFNEGLHIRQNRRIQLIETITNNDRNVFSQDQLEAKTLSELEGLAALAGSGSPNSAMATPSTRFTGAASPLGPIRNEELEALPIPVMNFNKKVS